MKERKILLKQEFNRAVHVIIQMKSHNLVHYACIDSLSTWSAIIYGYTLHAFTVALITRVSMHFHASNTF